MMEGTIDHEDEDVVPTLEEDPALGLSQRAKMEILFAVLLGLFLGALDQTIVGVALPKIVTQLNGNDLYVWVVTIYLLTSTITVPFWGKGSDLYGRKPIFMLGISIFLIGSALAGLSQNMAMLIAFRGIQGIGAGALFPVALAVIGDLFTPQERGKYQGLFGAVFGIAFLIGPALGGILTDTVGWHWIFYVNIPIGLVSLYFVGRLLPTVKRTNASRNFDLIGGAIFTVSITMLLIGLTNKQTNAWEDGSVGGLIIASLIGIALFIVAEFRAKEPIIPPHLFRIRTYSSSMVATFFASFGFFGALIFLPRYFQFVLGESATESGYQTLPLLAGLIFSSIVSGQIVARTGRYKWLTVGAILTMAVGLLMMTQLTAETPLPAIWFWMLVLGLGIGPTLATFTIIVQNAVPFHELGVATSNLTFFRQIGGSVALAITGTLFATSFAERVPTEIVKAGVPQPMADAFTKAGPAIDFNKLAGVGQDLGQTILASLPAEARAAVAPFITAIVQGIHEAFALAITQAFWVGIIAALIAAASAATMHEHALRTSHGPATVPVADGAAEAGIPAGGTGFAPGSAAMDRTTGD